MNTHRPELIIAGHSAAVTTLAFAADGQTLVSGSYDETAIVWDIPSETMRRLFRLRKGVNSLALTPDGKTLVTDDGRVWDVLTGSLLRTSRDYLAPLACSPDGTVLASSTFNRKGEGWVVLLSDLKTGKEIRRFECGYFQPHPLAFSSDGELVAVTGSEEQEDGKYVSVTTICELRTGKTHQTLRGHIVSLLAGIHLLPATRLVAVTQPERQLWDAETEILLHALGGKEATSPGEHVGCNMLSSDARLMAEGTFDGTLKVNEVSPPRLLWQTKAHHGWLRTLAFTYDSQTLASTGDDQSIRLWNAWTGDLQSSLSKRRASVEAVAFTAEGTEITALYEDDSVRYWRLDTACLEKQDTNRPVVLNLGAPKNSDTARHLWNIAPSLLPESRPPDWPNRINAISPNGSLVALHGYGYSPYYSLFVWDIQAQEMRMTMLDTYNPRGAIAFSPDNRYLAIGREERLIRLYDVSTGGIVKELTTPDDLWAVIRLAFSPDGRTLALGHGDYAVTLWDVSTGRIKRILDGYGDCVRALSFSPDGKTLAIGTAYSDMVWLKHLGRGGKHRFLLGHTDNVRTIDYSPDGTRLATGARMGRLGFGMLPMRHSWRPL